MCVYLENNRTVQKGKKEKEKEKARFSYLVQTFKTYTEHSFIFIHFYFPCCEKKYKKKKKGGEIFCPRIKYVRGRWRCVGFRVNVNVQINFLIKDPLL